MSRVRLAPTPARGAWRIAQLLAAAAAVSLVVLAITGMPSHAREIAKKADDLYGPTLPFGLVQFFGQGAMLVAGVYLARRWLKVRL